ncbi:MAG: hypothetical protein AAGC47_10380 [Bacteroidota bacterium]
MRRLIRVVFFDSSISASSNDCSDLVKESATVAIKSKRNRAALAKLKNAMITEAGRDFLGFLDGTN